MDPEKAVSDDRFLSLSVDPRTEDQTAAKSLWVLSFGIRPEMSFTDRRIVYVINAAALNLVFLSLSFVVINFFQGKQDLVIYNFWLIAVGLLGWGILAAGHHVLSLMVLNFGTAICFLLGALWFKNGAQSLLIFNLIVAVFLTPQVAMRWFLAAVSGVFFILVQMSQYHGQENGLEDWRYLTNTILFLLWLALMSELFRRLEERYLALIGERNCKLLRERAKVQSEHAKLLLRTRELRAANRMKEKLFSVISHDFRTPLANLQMALEAMGRGDIGRDEFLELQKTLSRDLQHAYSSLENLLLWSERQLKGVGFQPVETLLRDAANETAALLERMALIKGITMSIDIADEARVYADPEQLRAIFRNLLSNALKFSPAGGHVGVSAEKCGKEWMCSIKDSGAGLPPESVGEILEGTSLKSTHGTNGEKGFGLGLEICRDFVSQNGGRLWADNAEAGGGWFRFSIPSISGGGDENGAVP